MAESSHSIRILLVNDSVLFLQALKRFLARSNDILEIEIAEGSGDALYAAPRFQPHLILLDVNMPQVGGLALLPRLRTAVPAARILVVSFRADEHIRQAALAMGAEGFISKDRLSEELMPAIWNLFPQTMRRAS